MGTFSASLRALGDVQGLPATVELSDGVLTIAAGETPIGEWQVSDIHMEPIPKGYRIAAEGDQILLELEDIDRFNDELAAKRSRFRRKKKGVQDAAPAAEAVAEQVAVVKEPPPPPPSPVTLEPRTDVEEPKPKRKRRQKSQTAAAPKSGEQDNKLLNFVDNTLDKASEKLGPYLPEWVFTRIMFGIAFVALVLALVFPGWVSIFMLLAGAIIIVFGAVIYSDPMLASRWLPGRTTPTHVLLFGVVILMLGVLLGVIAG